MAKRYGKIDTKGQTVLKGRYSGKDITVSNDYATIYNDGVDKGFDVTSVTSHYNAKGKEEMVMHMTTPYTCNDKPVYGYAIVSTDSAYKLDNGCRNYNTCEFYDGDPSNNARNLEDVYPDGFMVKDKNGNDISYMEALDNMGMFASASSEYPHVSSYDEYITLKKPINERLGLPEPNEDDYNKYLNNCEGLMSTANGAKFIGDVKTVQDINKCRENTPSFIHFMNESQFDRELPNIEEKDDNQIEDNMSMFK